MSLVNFNVFNIIYVQYQFESVLCIIIYLPYWHPTNNKTTLLKLEMLHELLFALLGKPGTIFLADSKGFTINRTINVFKESQIGLLDQLADIGYRYRLIMNFVNQETCLMDYSNSGTVRRQPSVYRQTLALAMDKYLNNYLQLIQSIEHNYLQSKHFTLSNIKAQLVKYEFLFPQILQIISSIVNNNKRGGAIVDYVHLKYRMGNTWLQEVLDIVLKEFYKILVNQIIAWLLYGEIIDKNGEFFVHRVTFQPTHKFKFNNKNVRQVDLTDWQMYTIQASMIPNSFIKHQIAGKILFIGKSTKILKNCEKISILPSAQSLNEAKKLQQTSYSSNQLEQVIQQIRQNVAKKMINLIMEQQNFLKQLCKVNEYYLMTKGDFYHLLLQQSKNLDKIIQKQKALLKLNEQYLQNTFMRLNSFEDSKKILFQLRPLGFNFKGFKTFNQLCPVGNIDLIDGKSVRFNGSDGAIWHKTKQFVENGFHMSLIFRFKKYPKFFKSDFKQDSSKNGCKAILSVVIQSCQQVLPNSHTNPHNLRFVQQFLAIDIGFVSNQKQTQFGSFVSVYARNKSHDKPILLADKRLQKISLPDQGQYHLKMSYTHNPHGQSSSKSESNFRVSIGLPNSQYSYQQNQLSFDINLPYYINLQMGRAHVGLISNLLGSSHCAELQQWQLICEAANHYGDHWSDLGLMYRISWPLDLVLTHDLFDGFGRVHKFLFPIRQTLMGLQQIWKIIPRRMKQQFQITKGSKGQLITFERRLSIFRSKICLVISQLWKYFQSDVIEATWAKLKQSLKNTNDFEDLIKMVNKYIKSIQTMFFFNVPKIQRLISQIIRICKQFINYFKKVQDQNIDELTFSKLQQLKDNFDEVFTKFVNTLKQLAVISSSHHLFHLSQRMVSCCYKQTNQFRMI